MLLSINWNFENYILAALTFNILGPVVQSIHSLTLLLHSEWPKLYGVLAILSAIGFRKILFKDSFSLLVHIKSCVLIFFAFSLKDEIVKKCLRMGISVLEIVI